MYTETTGHREIFILLLTSLNNIDNKLGII